MHRPLKISKSCTGFGGNTVVTLVADAGDLPRHSLKVGEVVKLTPKVPSLVYETDSEVLSGMVIEIRVDELVVGLDDIYYALETLSTGWTVAKDENSIVYKRMHYFLELMRTYCGHEINSGLWPGDPKLISLLLPSRTKACLKFEEEESVSFNDAKLNQSQQDAIKFCLSACDASLIYGPPGTGKTQTLVELVRQIVCKDKRVLVCGPSNTSVDNLLERISAHPVKCLRLRNPDRLKLQHLSQYLLDTKVKQSASVCRIREQMNRLRDEIALCKDSREMRDELNELKQGLKDEEQEATKAIIGEHKVICSTLSGAGSRVLNGQCFDVLIIDEATQALEPECWIGISHAKSVVLVGDHHQLPPVVLRPGSGLETTLFQRLFETLSQISCMLNTQYRMHQKIVGFSSVQLYEDRLKSFDSVKGHLLSHLPHITNTLSSSSPLIFVNTAGKGLRESHGTKSKSNAGEVDLAIKHLKNLLKCGLDASSIAIISPYNAQVNLLRNELKEKYPKLEIGSVDGFQGREKEAVILSLVRSNIKRQIGFLKDYRRLNVAVTRARRHLCIIADKSTVMTNTFLSTKADFLNNLGIYLAEHALEWTPDQLN